MNGSKQVARAMARLATRVIDANSRDAVILALALPSSHQVELGRVLVASPRRRAASRRNRQPATLR